MERDQPWNTQPFYQNKNLLMIVCVKKLTIISQSYVRVRSEREVVLKQTHTVLKAYIFLLVATIAQTNIKYSGAINTVKCLDVSGLSASTLRELIYLHSVQKYVQQTQHLTIVSSLTHFKDELKL